MWRCETSPFLPRIWASDSSGFEPPAPSPPPASDFGPWLLMELELGGPAGSPAAVSLEPPCADPAFPSPLPPPPLAALLAAALEAPAVVAAVVPEPLAPDVAVAAPALPEVAPADAAGATRRGGERVWKFW